MNERDIVTRGIHTDCLLNYETVKYFGGEEHEGERYREAIKAYQSVELRVICAFNNRFIMAWRLIIRSINESSQSRSKLHHRKMSRFSSTPEAKYLFRLLGCLSALFWLHYALLAGN